MAGTAAVINPWDAPQSPLQAQSIAPLQATNYDAGILQPAANSGAVLGASTSPTPTPTPTPTGPTPQQIAANQQAAQIAQMTGVTKDHISHLNDIYNQIYGGIDQSVQGQRANIEDGFNNQFNGLDTQFGQMARGIGGAMVGRGISGSSYESQANQDALNQYDTSRTGIQQDEKNQLLKLGQFRDTEQAKYHGNQDYINNTPWATMYANNPYGMSSFLNGVDQRLVDAQTAQGGYGPNSQFQTDLAKIAPTQNQGAANLQKQLSTLIASSAPGFAKDQIASGLIRSNTQDDPASANYHLNYWKNLNPSNVGV